MHANRCFAPQRPLCRENRYKHKHSCLRAQSPAAFLLVTSGIWLQLWQQPGQRQVFSAAQAKLTLVTHHIWGQEQQRLANILSLPGMVRGDSLEETPGDSGLVLLLLHEKAKGNVSPQESSSDSSADCFLCDLQTHLPPPRSGEGSAWPCKALAKAQGAMDWHLLQPTCLSRQSPTLSRLCPEPALWWSHTSAEVPNPK